jgi:hypothetical protein
LWISLKSTVLKHCAIEFGFAIMPEWWVTDIVRQSGEFNEVRIYIVFPEVGVGFVKPDRYRLSNLRDF